MCYWEMKAPKDFPKYKILGNLKEWHLNWPNLYSKA